MSEMKQAVVVIPVYAVTPTSSDKIALRTFQKHLGNYDVVFVCPDSLNTDAYIDFFPRATCKRFDVRHFKSVKSYSRLLVSSAFYRCFRDFEYMLICQLDCLVFRDELKAWCDRNYSYIGPPWYDFNFIGGGKRVFFQAIPWMEKIFPRVGNGGFSLRRVGQHIRFAKKYRWLSILFFWLHEDLFWCGLIGRLERLYTIPDVNQASRFGIESNPKETYNLMGEQLPFGCHAWEKNEPEFWRQFIG